MGRNILWIIVYGFVFLSVSLTWLFRNTLQSNVLISFDRLQTILKQKKTFGWGDAHNELCLESKLSHAFVCEPFFGCWWDNDKITEPIFYFFTSQTSERKTVVKPLPPFRVSILVRENYPKLLIFLKVVKIIADGGAKIVLYFPYCIEKVKVSIKCIECNMHFPNVFFNNFISVFSVFPIEVRYSGTSWTELKTRTQTS